MSHGLPDTLTVTLRRRFTPTKGWLSLTFLNVAMVVWNFLALLGAASTGRGTGWVTLYCVLLAIAAFGLALCVRAMFPKPDWFYGAVVRWMVVWSEMVARAAVNPPSEEVSLQARFARIDALVDTVTTMAPAEVRALAFWCERHAVTPGAVGLAPQFVQAFVDQWEAREAAMAAR